jgi:glycosyltransferase involved in cell wall biosynthesis
MKISIITASLNRKEFIGAAIDSVLAQNFADFEHWIIDGGSTDGTLECLRRYPHLKLVSEPDRGVYDAWNKGIDRATGDVVGILNSDDVYAPGAFDSCAKLLAGSPIVQVVSGGCQIFRKGPRGNEIEMHRYQDPARYRLSLRSATLGLPIINGRFFRRSLFERFGRFNLEYPVASDREFLMRVSLEGTTDVCASSVYYRYLWHSGSLTMNAGNNTMLRGIEDGLEMIRKTLESNVLRLADKDVLLEWRCELLATRILVHAVMKEGATALTLAKESFKVDPRCLLALVRCGALATGRRARTTLRTWLQSEKAV